MNGEQVLAKGLIERIGMEGSVLKHTPTGKYTVDISAEIPDHSVGIQMALDALTNEEYGVIDSMDEIDAVGHRVVHGGERFTDSVLISDDVLNGIEACAEIAPLHNPPNLYGIKACMRLMYNTPQVAVFDTAFHQTMPKVAYLYGLPYEMYVKYGLRRYGFHGTSHKYVAQQAAEMMGEHMSDLRFITCHLGNGASIAAIKYGKSIDTSMGYTPLEGLVMGTRSGEIDPAIIPFLMEKENMNAQQIDDIRFINKSIIFDILSTCRIEFFQYFSRTLTCKGFKAASAGPVDHGFNHSFQKQNITGIGYRAFYGHRSCQRKIRFGNVQFCWFQFIGKVFFTDQSFLDFCDIYLYHISPIVSIIAML